MLRCGINDVRDLILGSRRVVQDHGEGLWLRRSFRHGLDQFPHLRAP